MTTMTREEILKAVSECKSFLGVDLSGADLRGAYLRGADLSGADLSGADLSGADLKGADLSGADLKGADLSGADLSGADLKGADLRGADLRGADLKGADLRGADLRGALTDADTKFPDFQLCPQEDSFIAWKKVRENVVLKLEIRGNRTSSLVGRKCRTDAVKVLAAFGENAGKSKEFKSLHDENFIYKIGKIVKAECDMDIKVECTKGIHFFMTREEAEGYGW